MQARRLVPRLGNSLAAAWLAVACGGSSATPAGAGGNQNTAAGSGGLGASGASTSAGGGGGSGGVAASRGGEGGTSIAGSTTGGGASNGGASGGSPSGGSPSGGGASGNGGSPATLSVDQLTNLNGCVPSPLPTDTDPSSPTFGQLSCQVIEASTGSCDCSKPGRAVVASQSVVTAIDRQLQATGNCGDASGQTACASFCMCEIMQEVGAAEAACQADPVAAAADSSVPPGFCYASDPTSSVLAQCPANQKQKLLFVSPSANPTPAPDSVRFLACAGG